MKNPVMLYIMIGTGGILVGLVHNHLVEKSLVICSYKHY